jgi:hypothetical protein
MRSPVARHTPQSPMLADDAPLITPFDVRHDVVARFLAPEHGAPVWLTRAMEVLRGFLAAIRALPLPPPSADLPPRGATAGIATNNEAQS